LSTIGDVAIIMGAPRAGKATQASALANRIGACHISSGDLMRKQGSPEMVKIMSEGGLVPESYFRELMEAAIREVPLGQPIVLEGVTKKPGEVPWLLELLWHLGRRVRCVIVLEIDLETLLQRNEDRGRDDDDDAVQTERWERWEQETRLSVEAYRERFLPMIEIDGRQPPKAIKAKINAALGI